jgi:hypothetical protein
MERSLGNNFTQRKSASSRTGILLGWCASRCVNASIFAPPGRRHTSPWVDPRTPHLGCRGRAGCGGVDAAFRWNAEMAGIHTQSAALGWYAMRRWRGRGRRGRGMRNAECGMRNAECGFAGGADECPNGAAAYQPVGETPGKGCGTLHAF